MTSKSSDNDALLSVMVMCKESQGKDADLFLRVDSNTNGLQHRQRRLLVEYALSGGFKTILHVMQLGSQSVRVQCSGIICFFFQMGRCSYG